MTPLATPNATTLISPLGTPFATTYDPLYRANPKRVKAHAVPYVDQFGDTIAEEYVIDQPHRDSVIIKTKAKPQQQAVTPLTFQSPLGDPYPYNAYMPMVSKQVAPNTKVLVIVYKGEAAWNDPVQLAKNLIVYIQNATTFHGVGFPSISFELAGGAVNVVNTYPPTGEWGYLDVSAVYQQFNICSRVASEGISEVWIYVDGKPGGHIYAGSEFVVNGPVWSMITGGPNAAPNCGRQMYTMFLNFDRGDAEELESWTHSAETSWILYQSSGYEACDVLTLSKYDIWSRLNWHQLQCRLAYQYSDLYAFTARPSITNTFVGMCGDAHFPPTSPLTGRVSTTTTSQLPTVIAAQTGSGATSHQTPTSVVPPGAATKSVT